MATNGGKASKLRSVGTNLTAAVETTIYTCPANHTAKVELVFVVNNTNGNKTVSMHWHDASAGDSYHITAAYTISAYSFLQMSNGYLVLNAGDYITCTSEAGSTMSTIVSAEEYFDPINNN